MAPSRPATWRPLAGLRVRGFGDHTRGPRRGGRAWSAAQLSRLVLAEPVGLRPQTHAQMAEDLGLDQALMGRFLQALGLPEASPMPDPRGHAEILEFGASAIGAGLPGGDGADTLGVFAEHLDRMAEHQRALFRSDVQDRMIDSACPRAQMLEASAEIRQRLVELAFRTTFLIHRRLLERQQFENTQSSWSSVRRARGAARAIKRPSPIVFVDLSVSLVDRGAG